MPQTLLEKALDQEVLVRELAGLEADLKDKREFSAVFMATSELCKWIRLHPEAVRERTVSILARILQSREHTFQRQARFLYKEAADGLAFLLWQDGVADWVAEAAFEALERAVTRASGQAQRAAAEALGSLPFRINGPEVRIHTVQEVPIVGWRELLERAGADTNATPTVKGRSLLVPMKKGVREILTVKMARAGDSPEPLQREVFWMQHFAADGCTGSVRFDIPTPVRIAGSPLLRITDVPGHERFRKRLHREGYGICFAAHRDYFTYVNDHRPEMGQEPDAFQEALLRNAWLLGRTAGCGIVHCAPIPLFHNRVQAERRPDSGLYEWPRGGRLDRWLESCRFPNLGLTGLRDFEHFQSFQGSGRELYHHVGAHILSLLLVAGSYFRNRDPQLVGFGEDGKPVDARGLFDRTLLQEMVRGIFLSYFRGFVGRAFSGDIPLHMEKLVDRMIEEMGVDHHMEEILRVPDQERMTDTEFREFLNDRGVHGDLLDSLQRGAGEIILHTGPHLGAFNSRISLPELIENTAATAALCIGAKFCDMRFGSKKTAGDLKIEQSSARISIAVPFGN